MRFACGTVSACKRIPPIRRSRKYPLARFHAMAFGLFRPAADRMVDKAKPQSARCKATSSPPAIRQHLKTHHCDPHRAAPAAAHAASTPVCAAPRRALRPSTFPRLSVVTRLGPHALCRRRQLPCSAAPPTSRPRRWRSTRRRSSPLELRFEGSSLYSRATKCRHEREL